MRHDLSFEIRDCRRYVRQRRLRVSNFKPRGCPACKFVLKELKSDLKAVDRSMGNGQLLVERPQLKISLSHFGQDQEADVAPGFLARKIHGTLGFIQFAESPKQVYFPKGAEAVTVISVIGNELGLRS